MFQKETKPLVGKIQKDYWTQSYSLVWVRPVGKASRVLDLDSVGCSFLESCTVFVHLQEKKWLLLNFSCPFTSWTCRQILKVFFNQVHNVSSVQFSHLVMSDSLWPHGLQHTMLPCPSPTPGAYSNSCPLSRWCLPTISSSVIPFSSCLQSFPVSGSFPMSQLFASGGQRNGASASPSVLPMNIQDWFPSGLTSWSPCSPRDSQESSPIPQFKSISSSPLSFLYSPTLTSIHDYWKNHSFD